MNENTRMYNTSRNLIVGLLVQVLLMAISFVSRMIFIKILGSEYLGINGLYSNILTLLSLAELGLGNVMLYSLYKPIEQKDEKKIAALINYYKRLYTFIAFAILILGISIVPFLKYLIKSSLNINELRNYYLIFLLNSVFSYVNIYKSTLINADQKMYLVKAFNTAFVFIQNIVQICILLFFKNYYLYLIIQVLFTLISNTYIGIKASKLYPFIKNKEELAKEEKSSIFKNMRSMLVYKIGTVILNSTDNILISVLIGTIFVGFYSNYSMIIGCISTVMLVVTNAMFSSIGNLNAQDSVEAKNKLFNTLVLLFHWVTSFCSICLFALLNDFITIWIGEEYLFSVYAVFAIVFNFYIGTVITPVWIYRETLGLFNQIKYVMLITSIINISLSIILGKTFGVAGIIVATAISRLLTNVWYEPMVLYRDVFKNKVRKYYFTQIKLFFLTAFASLITLFLIKFVTIGSLIGIIIKLIIITIIFNLIFWIFVRKTEEFDDINNKIIKRVFNMIKRILKINGVENA